MARAAGQGIEVLAITDHDTTDGLPEALDEARRHHIRVVPGVEISTLSAQDEIHLLGYFVDLENAQLQKLLVRTREARWTRAQKMLVRLEKLGLPLEWDRLVELSGGGSSIGRPHVAMSLLDAGHVTSWEEAFDRWIGRDCPAYVERYKLSPETAIQLINGAGGLAVLAHPYVYSRDGKCRKAMDLEHWLPRLRQAGLAGVETYYPNYPRGISRHLLDLAVKHGLIITGGSDFHTGAAGTGLGGVDVPWAAWEGLERRLHRVRVRGL